MLRTFGGLFVVLSLATVFIARSQSVAAARDGTTWQEPVDIPVGAKIFTDFQTLKKTGDAVYYRLAISQPMKLNWQINISRSASPKFAPQVVLFEPHTTTIGPILPVIQPPETIARVYPITPPQIVFEPTSQILTTVRLLARPELTKAGTYIFAVYNAGSAAGQFRFRLDHGGSTAEWTDVWRLPIRWWQDQLFAGFGWLTLITPLFLALGLWLVYRRLDHHRLHVHKTYSVKKQRKYKKS